MLGQLQVEEDLGLGWRRRCSRDCLLCEGQSCRPVRTWAGASGLRDSNVASLGGGVDVGLGGSRMHGCGERSRGGEEEDLLEDDSSGKTLASCS